MKFIGDHGAALLFWLLIVVQVYHQHKASKALLDVKDNCGYWENISIFNRFSTLQRRTTGSV